MLFRRKRARRLTERRAPYRKTPLRSLGLSVVVGGNSGPANGELVDISSRGARVRFGGEQDPDLALEDEIDFVLQSFAHGSVQLAARVLNRTKESGGSKLYGVEFLHAEEILAGLDGFYARLFNRRNARRVRPSFDRKIRLYMSWQDGEVEARVNDLSAIGVGLTMPLAEACRLDEVTEVYLHFRLPGSEEELSGPARIITCEAGSSAAHLGLAFDLEDPDGLARSRTVIEDYVARRSAEMERWEAGGG